MITVSDLLDIVTSWIHKLGVESQSTNECTVSLLGADFSVLSQLTAYIVQSTTSILKKNAKHDLFIYKIRCDIAILAFFLYLTMIFLFI